MCDSLCFVGVEGSWFAKNSDRPLNEVQSTHLFPERRASAQVLRTQYLDLGPDPGSFAFVGSQPDWLWGVEHGVNEHGVAIGNEKIWTIDNPRGREPALLGMDIVRLGLERATTADEAFSIVTHLVENFGQGGSGERDHDEPYHSGFLIADAVNAWVIETSDRTWAARSVHQGGVAMSNRVSLGHNWTHASANVPPNSTFQAWRAPRIPTAIADHRLAMTTASVTSALPPTAAQIVATLRHHGTSAWGSPFDDDDSVAEPIPQEVGDDFDGVSVCMHVRDYQVTTSSFVCALPRDEQTPMRVWCALGSPCVSVYLPLIVPTGQRLPEIPSFLSDPHNWHRIRRLRERAEADASGVQLGKIRAVLAPIERTMWTQADAMFRAGAQDHSAVVAWCNAIDAGMRQLAV